MAKYETERPFRGNAEVALAFLEERLTSSGLRITDRTPDAVVATAPKYRSTNQPALQAVGTITAAAGSGRLAAHATMDGVTWMNRFLAIFPIALTVGISVLTVVALIAFQAALPQQAAKAGLTTLWTATPFLLICPFLARWVRSRTERSVDELLDEAVAEAEMSEHVLT